MSLPSNGYRQPDRYPKMWFGTDGHMEWVDTPLQGADVSPRGWGVDGTTLTGGGYVIQSRNSHKTYNFEWKGTSARAMAQKMQDYRDGVFDSDGWDSRGLVYFTDPLTYTTNMLSKIWASPEIGIPTSSEGDSFHPFGTVSRVPTPDHLVQDWGYPRWGVEVIQPNVVDGFPSPRRATYLLHVPPPGPGKYNSIYISGAATSPEDFTSNWGLSVVAYFADGNWMQLPVQTATLPSGLFVAAVNSTSTTNPVTKITLTVKGSGVQIFGLRAILGVFNGRQLFDDVADIYSWFGGQGHSGCRFVGNPTYINNTSVNGGQIGYAATLKEVGSWIQ